MGASVTVYCLENLTDYLEFERLCHDLMSLEGYGNIEPLGGFSDKGRDAIHVSPTTGTTVFAYSVREDWRAKLAEDSDKIRRHGHACNSLVFVTTARFSPHERDAAVRSTKRDFGWDLKLYGVERLRVLLDAEHPHVKENHPQIFMQPSLDATLEHGLQQTDRLLVSYATDDKALAHWLARRLTAQGYRVWCEQLSLPESGDYPDDVNRAIRRQVRHVIALYSGSSLNNLEVMQQHYLALSMAEGDKKDFLLPLKVDDFEVDRLDRATASLRFISFAESWAQGLAALLEKLDVARCPRPLSRGRSMAVSSFQEEHVVADAPEPLFSNCLQVVNLPRLIQRYTSPVGISRDESDELQLEWPHRFVNRTTFLSFSEPSARAKVTGQLRPDGGGSCTETSNLERIPVPHLVSELVRRSLFARCHLAGLEYCAQTRLQYFPFGLTTGNRLRLERPDGTRTWVNSAGERKYRRTSGPEYYRYYLAPAFYVRTDVLDGYTVLANVRVRVTDTNGTPLAVRQALSRRKHVCRDWWNREWLNRMLAILQYLADGDSISYGVGQQRLVVSARPWSIDAPRRVDESRPTEPCL
ncbi:MAG: TIR domain-containing protein [Chloroflexi bacterium]|nr:TIR domain-containing protein [Chloroflexota bacterium]